jgi:hypothetical protein
MVGTAGHREVSIGDGQLDAIRATLDPPLAPFQRDGGLELPWLAIATSVV